MTKQLRGARHKRVMAVLVATREEAGVSQRELARRIGRAHSYIGRIETGTRRLDLPEFIEWCEALDADPVMVMRRIMGKK
jgi:transcriptional regulator with XRE-family HTH domain